MIKMKKIIGDKIFFYVFFVEDSFVIIAFRT